MAARPKLDDIEPFRVKYSPGDRIIARISVDLSVSQKRSIIDKVRAFCKADVDVMIVDCRKVAILIERSAGQTERLAGPEDVGSKTSGGKLSLNLSRVVFLPNDKVKIVWNPKFGKSQIRQMFKSDIVRWVGKDHEVVEIN